MWSRNRRPLPILLLLFLSFAGCVSHRDLARSSVQYNRAIEEGQNQMLLLNVLRASRKSPMYVTSFAKVTGSNSASVELSLPDGGASTTTGSFGVNPTFDVPVLDSQEFTTGFMTPVKSSLFAYYWDQDWPEEILLHLLVNKVLVRIEKGGVVHDYYFWNHPDVDDVGKGKELCKLEKFSRWVNYFVFVGNPGFRPAESKAVGPEYDGADIKLSSLVSLLKEGFEISPEGGKFQLKTPAKGFELEIEGRLIGGQEIEATRQAATEAIATWTEESHRQWACDDEEYEAYAVGPSPSQEGTQATGQAAQEASQGAEDPLNRSQQPVPDYAISGKESFRSEKGEDTKLSVSLFMRSPEAVLYYLGQLTRVEDRLEWVPRICIDQKPKPLFVARKVTPWCTNGAITAQYDNQWYTVPKGGQEERKLGPEEEERKKQEDQALCAIKPFKKPDRPLFVPLDDRSCEPGLSMQALSLAVQLINLQKSAKDLPTTSTVRVVGQTP